MKRTKKSNHIKCQIQRIFSEQDFTAGVFRINGAALYFTLEDEIRSKKVWGETCIPAGTYDLTIQRRNTSLTKRYKKRYPWFEKHIMIKDVPNFKDIYIHIGNDDEDTAGCPLVGMSCDLKNENGFIGSSTIAFRDLYMRLYPFIKRGDKVTIEILNP